MEFDEYVERVRMNDPAVTRVIISDRIVIEEMHAIADAIAVNTVVTELGLYRTQMTDTLTEILAEALKINASIKFLDLSNNSIGDIGARAIADVIGVNQVIKRLELGMNQIQEDGLRAIANALERNADRITIHINLNFNGINAQGIRAFIPALAKINNLGLMYNPIGDLGAAMIARALQDNRTLYRMDLSNCSIGDNGAIELGRSLSTNRALKHLHLEDNAIGNVGLAAIAGGIVHNRVIQRVVIENLPAAARERMAENVARVQRAALVQQQIADRIELFRRNRPPKKHALKLHSRFPRQP